MDASRPEGLLCGHKASCKLIPHQNCVRTQSWAQDTERRKQAQVPEEIREQTKPEIALGLLDRARQGGVPIQAVVVDAGYGDNPNFLRGLDGVTRLVRVKHTLRTTQCETSKKHRQA